MRLSRGDMAGIGCLCIWSTLALTVTLSGNIPPLQLTALVCLLGAAIIFASEVLRGVPWQTPFRQSFKIYLFGTVGIGVYTLLFNCALKWAPPFIANALNYLWPIFLTLGLAIAARTRPKVHEAMGLLLGLTGASLIFYARADNTDISFGPQQWLGCVFAFSGAIVWATYSVMAKRVSYPVITVSVFFLITGLFSGVLHLWLEETIWPSSPIVWLVVVYLGTARLSYSLWDYAMKQGDQALLSSLSYLVPLGSMGWLVLAGYLPSAPVLLLAGTLIITGCLISNYERLLKLLK